MMWGSSWHFHKAKRSLGKLFCFFLTLPFFCLVYSCLMLQFSVPRTLQWWSLHGCVSLFQPSLLQVWYLCFHCTKVLPACSHQHSGVLKQSVLCMTYFQLLFWGTVNNIRLSVVTSLYVATIVTIYRGSWGIDTIKCQLQIALNCQVCWTVAGGFALPATES